MDKADQDECKRLIKQLRGYTSEHWKTKRRNELYDLIGEDIRKWIAAICKHWGKYNSKQEVISLSWDIFEFCLKHYKNGYPVISHFYNYTKYYLLNRYAKSEAVHIHLDELKDVYSNVCFPESCEMERLITLMQFREVIPSEHKVVWDDAVQSLSKAPKERNITVNHNLTQNTYFNLKRSFKCVIKLILGMSID